MLTKSLFQTAMQLPGFEHWRPQVDVPHLVRPRQRPPELPGEGRMAAVMLMVCPARIPDQPQTVEPILVLTRRCETLSKHAGQISFPGGRQDAGETLATTALRETSEEIGVAPQLVTLLGQLNSVYIPPSDFTVAPFVGWLNTRMEFIPADEEVAEIIEVPIHHLLKPDTLATGPVQTDDGSILKVPYYQVEHHRVWGATAIILAEFIERILRATDLIDPSGMGHD